jgi:hypothetical protein
MTTTTINQNDLNTTIPDGSSVVIQGTNDTIATNSSSIQLLDNSQVEVDGNNNQIQLGNKDQLTVTGSGDTITTNDQVDFLGGIINLVDGTSASVVNNSALDVVNLIGNGETLSVSGNSSHQYRGQRHGRVIHQRIDR